MKNTIKECTHFCSVNRILETVDLRISYRAYILRRSVYKSLITITRFKNHTIKFLDICFSTYTCKYIDKYIKTILLVNSIDKTSKIFITIGRNQCNLIHIINSTFLTIRSDNFFNLFSNLLESLNDICRRNFKISFNLCHTIEDKRRENSYRSCTITDFNSLSSSFFFNVSYN